MNYVTYSSRKYEKRILSKNVLNSIKVSDLLIEIFKNIYFCNPKLVDTKKKINRLTKT